MRRSRLGPSLTGLLGAVVALLLVACAPNDDAPAASSTQTQESTANGVDCDVRYDALDADALQEVTILNPTEVPISPKERIRHLNELASVSPAFIDVLRVMRIPVELTGGSITTFNEFAHLRGVTPRGWEGTGLTWDVVPGGGTARGIFLGDSAKPNNAWSLAIHEGTHAVDLSLAFTRTNPHLHALYIQERGRPIAVGDQNAAYRRSNIEEFLAVAVDEYFCSKATRAGLEVRYPEMFAYIANDLDWELSSTLP